MSVRIPQLVFAPKVFAPGNGEASYLGWESYHLTLVETKGVPDVLGADFKFDRHRAAMVVHFDQMNNTGNDTTNRQSLSGIGIIKEQLADGREHVFCGSLSAGELFGVVVEYATSSTCPFTPVP